MLSASSRFLGSLVRFLKYMNVRRLWNEIRCRSSYMLSIPGVARYGHMPTFLSIEPANWCMLRCPQCPVGMRGNTPDAERQAMSLALCRRIIDEASPCAHTVIFHFQGEPLLNKQLPEMIEYAHQQKLFTMLSTNAQTLSADLAEALCRSGLDRIIISVDGLSQESYSHYRVGGFLEKALSGIRALADCKKALGYGPEIVLQCLYLGSNEHEWGEIRQQYRSLGADKLAMKTAQFYDFEDGNPDMPSDERYSRYAKDSNGKYRLKSRLKNRCYRLWSGCVVTTDGVVLPCCFDKDHTFPLGRITEQSLKEIMQGAAARRFRQSVVKGRQNIGICRNCAE